MYVPIQEQPQERLFIIFKIHITVPHYLSLHYASLKVFSKKKEVLQGIRMELDANKCLYVLGKLLASLTTCSHL